jgi:hypothetical protein
MRNILLALLIAAPAAAFAQTPADVAHLLQAGPAISVSDAPVSTASFAGSFTARDLASAASVSHNTAPAVATASGMVPADLVRLAGIAGASQTAGGALYHVAAR